MKTLPAASTEQCSSLRYALPVVQLGGADIRPEKTPLSDENARSDELQIHCLQMRIHGQLAEYQLNPPATSYTANSQTTSLHAGTRIAHIAGICDFACELVSATSTQLLLRRGPIRVMSSHCFDDVAPFVEPVGCRAEWWQRIVKYECVNIPLTAS